MKCCAKIHAQISLRKIAAVLFRIPSINMQISILSVKMFGENS